MVIIANGACEWTNLLEPHPLLSDENSQFPCQYVVLRWCYNGRAVETWECNTELECVCDAVKTKSPLLRQLTTMEVNRINNLPFISKIT